MIKSISLLVLICYGIIGSCLLGEALPVPKNVLREDKSRINENELTFKVSSSGTIRAEAIEKATKIAITEALKTLIPDASNISMQELISAVYSNSSNFIRKQELLTANQLPNGTNSITVDISFYMEKLAAYLRAKGFQVIHQKEKEITLSKQFKLDEQNEMKSMENILAVLHEPMQLSASYEMSTSNPKESIKVIVRANKNYVACIRFLIENLNAISLSAQEIETYAQYGKATYQVICNYNQKDYTFNLRNYTSLKLLRTFKANREFYMRMFQVSNSDQFIQDREFKLKLNPDQYKSSYFEGSSYRMFFFHENEIMGCFEKTENLPVGYQPAKSKFKVTSTGIRSAYKYGGIVFHTSSDYLLIANYCCFVNSKQMTEAATNQTAKNVNTAAANWRKPNKDELNLLGNFLSRNQIKLVSFNDDEEEEEAWDDPSMVVWDDEEEEWNEETDDSLGMLIRKVHPDGSPID